MLKKLTERERGVGTNDIITLVQSMQFNVAVQIFICSSIDLCGVLLLHLVRVCGLWTLSALAHGVLHLLTAFGSC